MKADAEEFSEARIIEILRLLDTGFAKVDVCRRFGISIFVLERWLARYAVSVGAAAERRIDALLAENARLRGAVQQLTAENRILRLSRREGAPKSQ